MLRCNSHLAFAAFVSLSLAPLGSAATIAEWTFEEGTPGATAAGDGTITDVAGQHNGTPLASPVYTSASVGGGSVGLHFDGVNARVAIPDDSAFVLTHSLTLEAVIYIDHLRAGTLSYNQIIFRGDDRSGYDPYALGVSNSSGKLTFRFDSATGITTELDSPSALPLQTWISVASTLDDATGLQRIYVNGQLVASATTSQRPLGTLNSSYLPGLGIGDIQSNTYNERFAGTIADVRISDVALSPSQFITVPEPTALLGLLGAGSLAMLRRRRRVGNFARSNKVPN